MLPSVVLRVLAVQAVRHHVLRVQLVDHRIRVHAWLVRVHYKLIVLADLVDEILQASQNACEHLYTAVLKAECMGGEECMSKSRGVAATLARDFKGWRIIEFMLSKGVLVKRQAISRLCITLILNPECSYQGLVSHLCAWPLVHHPNSKP